jgi:hypothetical protein
MELFWSRARMASIANRHYEPPAGVSFKRPTLSR